MGAVHGPVLGEPLFQVGLGRRIGQISNIQYLSHEVLLVARFFDLLNPCWVDEKGHTKKPKRWEWREGEAESDSMRTQGAHSVVRPTY